MTRESSDEQKRRALQILVRIATMDDTQLEIFARGNLKPAELIGIFTELGVAEVDEDTLSALQEVVEDYCDRQVSGYNDWNARAKVQWESLSRRLMSVASETFD